MIPISFGLNESVRAKNGDEPYQMAQSKWGDDLGPSGLGYNPQRYDVNANNEITARDMSILAYHIVNDLPEMLEYTKQAHTTIMEGTPLRAKLR